MPARQLAAPPTPPIHHRQNSLVAPIAGVAAAFSILMLLTTLCLRKISRKPTVPSSGEATDSSHPRPRKFSHSLLRRATSSFSPSLRLGQGGFGSVYRGTLQKPDRQVAVKVMEAGSLQGEREFHNELFFAGKVDSKHIVSVLGFSSDRKRRRMLLVYELMANGSLQDCLFHRKCIELKDWRKRFSIALGIARGLEYLHHFCDPPVIHGDIKPSNILLDDNFDAKIGDFGLARLKSEENPQVEIEVKKDVSLEDNGSVVETESVITEAVHVGIEQSPESVITGVELSPEVPIVSPRTVAAMMSPSEALDKTSVSEVNSDGYSMGSGKEAMTGRGKRSGKKKESGSGKEWWKKQDNGGQESGKVKDYVMEWIGNEIKKERPKSEWAGTSSSSGVVVKAEKKRNRRRLDWWVSMDDDKNAKKDRRRPASEWWKEEYAEELARKKKKKKKKKQRQGYLSDDQYSDNWWPRDEGFDLDRKKKRSRSRGSKGSMDWWLDGISGELWGARRNSHDSISGEIPNSGVSSTPSMRGTVCYVAPEYGGGGDLSEKCDVYSYGVLLLVLIAGRRPLQVTGSPMKEFQRANLLSWTRHLARRGKLLELVDQSVESVDKEQAVLCITTAMQCLQKSPASRPCMKEVVGFLSGDLEPPQLPVEFSPSPPSRFPFKSPKKGRGV